jgi:tetratricopeptide (TPR) repeat protein
MRIVPGSPARRGLVNLRPASRRSLAICTSQVGQAIENLPSLGLHSSAELAFHFAQGASVLAARKTIDYAIRAGDRANDLFAYEEAIRLYRQALEAMERLQDARYANTVPEVQVRLGIVLSSTGAFAEAIQPLTQAVDGFNGDHRRKIEALISLSRVHAATLRDSGEAARTANEALELIQLFGEDELTGDAMAALAAAETLSGNLVQGLKRFELAVSEHGFMAGPVTSMDIGTFGSFGLSLYWAGKYGDAEAQARRQVALARAPVSLVGALPPMGMALAARGLYEEAEAAFVEARRVGKEHHAVTLPRAISMSSGYHLDLYDYDGAEALTIEARELALQENSLRSVGQTGIDLMLNYCRRGEIGRAKELLGEVGRAVRADPSGPHAWLLPIRLGQAQAELLAAERDWSGALQAADETLKRARQFGRPKYESLALVTRARALLGLGKKREAIAQFQAASAGQTPR